MFARSSVELATYLFENIPYDYEKIILSDPDSLKSLWKRYTRERCENAIKAYMNTLFIVDNSLDKQMPHLIDMVMAQYPCK